MLDNFISRSRGSKKTCISMPTTTAFAVFFLFNFQRRLDVKINDDKRKSRKLVIGKKNFITSEISLNLHLQTTNSSVIRH